MRRFIVAISATACLATAAIGVGGPVGASANANARVSCKRLTGTIITSVTISYCSPRSATNTSATAPSSAFHGSGTLVWSKSGQTTDITLTFTSPGQGKCRRGSFEYDVTGSVTGGTSTYTASGDVVSALTCVSGTGAITLVPLTVLSL